MEQESSPILGIIVLLILGVIGLAVYFIPYLIACIRGSKYKGVVFILNLFAGWTGILWIVALVMAVWPNGENTTSVSVNIEADALSNSCKNTPEMEKLVLETVDVHKKRIKDDRIHLKPNIPQKQLNNAIRSYAKGIAPEDVIVLVDNSMFGSGKVGIILTPTMIFGHSQLEKPLQFPLQDVKNIYLDEAMTTSHLYVNDAKFAEDCWPDKSKMRFLTKMLNEILDKLKKDEATPKEKVQSPPELPEIQVATDTPQPQEEPS